MTEKLTPEQFSFWLQGFCELGGGQVPSQEQWDSICEHLNLVFNKVTKPLAKLQPSQKSVHQLLEEAGKHVKPSPVNMPWPAPTPYALPVQPVDVNRIFGPGILDQGPLTLTC